MYGKGRSPRLAEADGRIVGFIFDGKRLQNRGDVLLWVR